ncbi:uncharacterized protein LOC107878092 [Capsicum annuum]|uniref:uncharacterized protein LOC107878092 n=1 Tax=Capsicum annuum TaxID=4072 RepID=UPI001FB17666|nr:uncharacterized protein LOC107878092 [Capsicum annuum]
MDTCQDDSYTSYLQGKNAIPYTPMNLECYGVASSSQMDVVAVLPSIEGHDSLSMMHDERLIDSFDHGNHVIENGSESESMYYGKESNICLANWDDHVFETSLELDGCSSESKCVYSKSAPRVDSTFFRHNILFEDSTFTPNEPSGANDGVTCLEGYSLYVNLLWRDNIPPQDGNLFLEDESTLKSRECVVLERNSQSSEDDLESLECLGNPKCDCSCDNVLVCDPFAAQGDLYLYGDYSLERECGACLEIPSTSSLCVSYVKYTSVDGLETSEYMHKETIAEVGLSDTFLYPLCAHDISTSDLEGVPNFEEDTLGESESGRDLVLGYFYPLIPVPS